MRQSSTLQRLERARRELVAQLRHELPLIIFEQARTLDDDRGCLQNAFQCVASLPLHRLQSLVQEALDFAALGDAEDAGSPPKHAVSQQHRHLDASAQVSSSQSPESGISAATASPSAACALVLSVSLGFHSLTHPV